MSTIDLPSESPDEAQGTPVNRSLDDFLASHGGPFYELQARLGLLHESALNCAWRAILFVTAAWGGPFLLGIPASISIEPGSYLADPGAWAKFLVAIAAFVLAEKYVEQGLRVKLGQFIRAPLLSPASTETALLLVNTALARRNSGVAELVCLLLAAVVSVASYESFLHVGASFWAVDVSPDGNAITLAGWWSILISLPLSVFLFLRGIWRHFVWGELLRGIAKLELRLVATHPDGRGGLAFLAEYPNAYALFILGTSSVVASAFVKHLIHDTLSATVFGTMLGAWLAVVMLFFAYPLSVFSGPLSQLKERSLLLLGAQGTRFHRSVERKILKKNAVADDPDEFVEDEELDDPTKQFEVVRKMSSILISRKALLPVGAAALLPFVVVGVQRLPMKEVISLMKKLLLL